MRYHSDGNLHHSVFLEIYTWCELLTASDDEQNPVILYVPLTPRRYTHPHVQPWQTTKLQEQEVRFIYSKDKLLCDHLFSTQILFSHLQEKFNVNLKYTVLFLFCISFHYLHKNEVLRESRRGHNL